MTSVRRHCTNVYLSDLADKIIPVLFYSHFKDVANGKNKENKEAIKSNKYFLRCSENLALFHPLLMDLGDLKYDCSQ